MKAGTIVKLPDGREGTVVYHHIDGYGIVFGRQAVDVDELPEPQAMLRRLYPSATVPCIGEAYEVIRETAGEDEA